MKIKWLVFSLFLTAILIASAFILLGRSKLVDYEGLMIRIPSAFQGSEEVLVSSKYMKILRYDDSDSWLTLSSYTDGEFHDKEYNYNFWVDHHKQTVSDNEIKLDKINKMGGVVFDNTDDVQKMEDTITNKGEKYKPLVASFACFIESDKGGYEIEYEVRNEDVTYKEAYKKFEKILRSVDTN